MRPLESELFTNSAQLPGGLEAGEQVLLQKKRPGFGPLLAGAAEAMTQPQQAAAKAVEQFNRGAEGELHQTLMAVDKADISLKFFVTARNRCLEAYREIMRMGS